MSLKDLIVTPDDVRKYGPDEDPLLYVAADWKGTILDIFDVKGVSDSGKLWAVSQFLDEKYHRQWVLNCLSEASTHLALNAKLFFATDFPEYQKVIDGVKTVAAEEIPVLAETKAAGENLRIYTKQNFDYARLMWAFRWACEPFDYRESCRLAIRDVVTSYGKDSETGWAMCKEKLLEIIDIHP